MIVRETGDHPCVSRDDRNDEDVAVSFLLDIIVYPKDLHDWGSL